MRHSKKLAALAIAAGVAVIGTAAFAYWTSEGSGDGSAAAGTSSPWIVESVPAVGAPLTPNGPTQTIGYSVENENSGVQRLAQVVISIEDIGRTVDEAWVPEDGCTAADFSVGGEAAGANYTDLNAALIGDFAKDQVKNSSVSLQMVDTHADQDDCKGVTVKLAFDAS